jgi:IS5 family transposase
LTKRLKTTTASLHDSCIDLSEKNEVVHRDRGYFGAKSKGYDTTMKRAVKEQPMGISEKLKNARVS